jgi:hypothetical protein
MKEKGNLMCLTYNAIWVNELCGTFEFCVNCGMKDKRKEHERKEEDQ